MDKESLKRILDNIKRNIAILESEIYSDVDSYLSKDECDYKVETSLPVDYDIDEFYEEEPYESSDEQLYGYGKQYRITNDDDGDGL